MNEERKIEIIASLPLPKVNTRRLIWQPVTDHDGLKMRLALLDWQPSGAHCALEHLAAENDKLLARINDLELAQGWRTDMENAPRDDIEIYGWDTTGDPYTCKWCELSGRWLEGYCWHRTPTHWKHITTPE